MTFHSIERLGSPFLGVSELGFTIPLDGGLILQNPERKLIFFLQADCTADVEGAGTFQVRSGDALVVPCRCVQRYRIAQSGQSNKVHALKIAFNLPPLNDPAQRTTASLGRQNPEANLGAFIGHHFRQVRHLPSAQTAPIQEILRAIRSEAEEHRPGIRHRVRALATNLVVHLARLVHEPHSRGETEGALLQVSLVNEIKEYLMRNYSRNLTLGEIGWHVRKSEEHAARVFRKATGQTIFDYLRTIRLESAKTLLVNSDKTLTEIARLSGFGSLALFSRNFSHYVGRNPSAYRAERAGMVTWRPA